MHENFIIAERYKSQHFVSFHFIFAIKTHSSVSAAKKTKEDARHTSVLFTGTIKLPNSAFCISKTTLPISTKFTYFLLYVYTTSHSKFEGNSFSSS